MLRFYRSVFGDNVNDRPRTGVETRTDQAALDSGLAQFTEASLKAGL
ncbi:hypothetical protein AAG122_20960 [Raoultella planticola]